MTTRRQAIASALALGALPWAHAATSGAPQRLVVVLLRGAVDGLSVVAPHADADYRRERPTIALPGPGQDGGVLDLDGRFGLHPALKDLQPLWAAGQLGFVHACGAQASGRSHFEAQDELESGTPGVKTTQDGWMGRLLTLGGDSDAVRAVYAGPTRPRILGGHADVAALPAGNGGRGARSARQAQPALAAGLEKLYAEDPRYAKAWAEGQRGREQMAQALVEPPMMSASGAEREMMAADNGAPPAAGFPDDARRLARVMRGDPRVQFALLQAGGWDTHVRQGASTGQLAGRLAPIGQGLALLARELGPLWRDTVVLVVSEFGRTVRENGNGGTDHGHGNVLWALGGRVQGGRVHGDWPGLEASARYQGRDLAITTDYRAVFAGVAAQHLGLKDAQLARLFPGYGGGVLPLLRA
ncbi:DUF1501 domain-containing protein [Inhella crocodyli]|jgi:uncharacterized protein (DUF1501 family)|uniref:DUF1501 domain-containing protein n=1 Tax=Inhella crocodyli TaxID=2499851 RepID=A0A437LHZ6_9BURK|nr:DUF1501 domain-containing protein [Inhella crocodyli]RVT84991.1 DUF1501 domain-containing protein [Inhella crocodyli]